MKEYLTHFLWKYDFPKDAKRVLLHAYERIYSSQVTAIKFEKIIDAYEENMNFDFTLLIEAMSDISVASEIPVYTGNLVMLICLSQALKVYYEKAGVDEQIWISTMQDLKWKAKECKQVENIWGCARPKWLAGYYTMQRFGFGRLQFELRTLGTDYQKGDIQLNRESPVLNGHIPCTGTRLDKASVYASYEQAKAFYQEAFSDNPLVFVCRSWLLFPRHKEVLLPNSNLALFIADYDIVDSGEYGDYREIWRVFGQHSKGDLELLPQNTLLQRVYAEWMRKKEKTGWGYGVFIWKNKYHEEES